MRRGTIVRRLNMKIFIVVSCCIVGLLATAQCVESDSDWGRTIGSVWRSWQRERVHVKRCTEQEIKGKRCKKHENVCILHEKRLKTRDLCKYCSVKQWIVYRKGQCPGDILKELAKATGNIYNDNNNHERHNDQGNNSNNNHHQNNNQKCGQHNNGQNNQQHNERKERNKQKENKKNSHQNKHEKHNEGKSSKEETANINKEKNQFHSTSSSNEIIMTPGATITKNSKSSENGKITESPFGNNTSEVKSNALALIRNAEKNFTITEKKELLHQLLKLRESLKTFEESSGEGEISGEILVTESSGQEDLKHFASDVVESKENHKKVESKENHKKIKSKENEGSIITIIQKTISVDKINTANMISQIEELESELEGSGTTSASVLESLGQEKLSHYAFDLLKKIEPNKTEGSGIIIIEKSVSVDKLVAENNISQTEGLQSGLEGSEGTILPVIPIIFPIDIIDFEKEIEDLIDTLENPSSIPQTVVTTLSSSSQEQSVELSGEETSGGDEKELRVNTMQQSSTIQPVKVASTAQETQLTTGAPSISSTMQQSSTIQPVKVASTAQETRLTTGAPSISSTLQPVPETPQTLATSSVSVTRGTTGSVSTAIELSGEGSELLALPEESPTSASSSETIASVELSLSTIGLQVSEIPPEESATSSSPTGAQASEISPEESTTSASSFEAIASVGLSLSTIGLPASEIPPEKPATSSSPTGAQASEESAISVSSSAPMPSIEPQESEFASTRRPLTTAESQILAPEKTPESTNPKIITSKVTTTTAAGNDNAIGAFANFLRQISDLLSH